MMGEDVSYRGALASKKAAEELGGNKFGLSKENGQYFLEYE